MTQRFSGRNKKRNAKQALLAGMATDLLKRESGQDSKKGRQQPGRGSYWGAMVIMSLRWYPLKEH